MDNSTIKIELGGSATDVLFTLFLHGPTFDGDVPSKSGRDELVSMGLADRHDGYQQLTLKGLRVAMGHGLDREKERRSRRMGAALSLYHVVHQHLQKEGLQATDTCAASAKALTPDPNQ